MAKIVVTRMLTAAAHETLRRLSHDVVVRQESHPPTDDELAALVAGSDAIICTLTEQVNAPLFDAAGPGLQIVANVAVGVDNIDLQQAAARQITVTNTPGVLTDATADLAFGLILAAARRIGEGDRFLRSGLPWVWGPTFLVGRPIAASTLGIVGYGRIGQAVARRARGFGMRVVATGGKFLAANGAADEVKGVTLDELLATADVVSVHCPLTAQTEGLIGAAELAKMKETAVLVNTARGAIIDEAALVEALRSRTIFAAGLDVFEHEPDLHPGLRDLDNVVLAPHIGSADERTRDQMCAIAIDNVSAVLDGKPPLSPVV